MTSAEQPLPLPLNAQRVVAFLALQERAVPRSFVAGSLWLDASDPHSSASLRSTLWRIGCVTHELIEASKSHIQLARNVAVDIRELARIAHQDPAEATQSDLVELPRRLAGDLLPGWYEEWLLLDRERLRQLCLHALERLCVRLTVTGRFSDAVEAGLAAVRLEPLRESARRALIGAYLAEGDRASALRAFDGYARDLRGELGLAPSEDLARLVRRPCVTVP